MKKFLLFLICLLALSSTALARDMGVIHRYMQLYGNMLNISFVSK